MIEDPSAIDYTSIQLKHGCFIKWFVKITLHKCRHGTHIRWKLRNRCARHEHKSDIFSPEK